MDLLVTIIVPVYNVKAYLRECIDSVLRQTYKNLEILLIDDGSSDGSAEICEDYMKIDSRIRSIHKENGGQSSARNLGMKYANGNYIYYLDSDDYINDTTIEKLVDTATTYCADLVFFDGISFYDNKEIKKEFRNIEYSRTKDYGTMKGSNMANSLMDNDEFFLSVCHMFFKRSLAEQLSFFEGIIHEDNLYVIEAFLKSDKATHLHEQLYHRRIRFGSTMTIKFSEKNFHGYFICIRELMKVFDCSKADSEEYILLQRYLSDYSGILIDKYAEFDNEHKIISKNEYDELRRMLRNNNYLHSYKISFIIRHRRFMKIYNKIINK